MEVRFSSLEHAWKYTCFSKFTSSMEKFMKINWKVKQWGRSKLVVFCVLASYVLYVINNSYAWIDLPWFCVCLCVFCCFTYSPSCSFSFHVEWWTCFLPFFSNFQCIRFDSVCMNVAFVVYIYITVGMALHCLLCVCCVVALWPHYYWYLSRPKNQYGTGCAGSWRAQNTVECEEHLLL